MEEPHAKYLNSMKQIETSTPQVIPTPRTNWANRGGNKPLYYGPYGWNNLNEIKEKFDRDFERYAQSNLLRYRHLMAGEGFRNKNKARTPSL